MQPSLYQQAIFDWIATGTGSAVIEAVAGSGKTTTILKSLEMIPNDQSILMLAFNKSIADELKTRAPAHVTVKTFNGLGHGLIKEKRGGYLRLESGKMRDIVKASMDAFEYREIGAQVLDLAGFVRRMGLLPEGAKGTPLMEDTPESWEFLISHFGIAIDKDSRQTVIDYTRNAVKASVERAGDEGVIDFDDQIFIPAIRGIKGDTYDWVFVDEAQDVSPVRIALLKLALKEGGRLVAVGDSRQAIYGFTGSDAEAMNSLRADFNAISLPLSISYRCAKSVVAAAQEVMPTIEASETAPQGEVRLITAWELSDLQGGDMVLCRSNAPVVALAWRLIAAGIPARILGRDIGAGLTSLIERLKPKGLKGQHGLLEKLFEWQVGEIQKWSKEGRDDMIDAVTDKVDCISAIVQRTSVQTVPDLIRSIEAMFSNDSGASAAITLCSIHKSKGLEATRVFFLDADLIPIKYARQDWQITQEWNLKYVGITRAKKSLFFVESKNLVERLTKAA